MTRPPPRSKRPDTRFPYTTLFRSEPRELARHIEHGDLRTEGRITPFVLRAAGEEKRCCREGQEPDRASAQDRRHPHHGEEWVPSRNGWVLLRPQAGQERLDRKSTRLNSSH